MFNKILKINLIIIFFASILFAEVINDIKVVGNKRISKESIIVFGKIVIGENYSQNNLNTVLKSIYETNFFSEVNLDIKNSILLITVNENPIIESVELNGIKNNKLNEFIKEKIILKERKSFIQSSLTADLNLIKNIVKSSGYYFAKINTRSTLNEDQNSIELIYDIDLGKKAEINQIQFLGDKKIKDKKLKNVITSEESKFWKFLSQAKYLNYDQIALDKRLLINFYKNNGYYNVKVSNSFVEFKNNGSFKLIYNIDAGNIFKFKTLSLDLSDDYDKKYFINIDNAIKKLENKEYSLNKIERVLKEIDKIALSKQYEFIDASLTETVVNDNELNIVFSLVDTKKFYVEKINILGNTYTIEEVVRNAFIVDEGDAFNEILFNRSINNIKSKNIFSKVDAKILDGNDENLKIINLTVEEKPTGEISLGAGFGSSGGTIGGGIKENNFLGKGIKLNTNLAVTANSVTGQFIYNKPNFNYSENSLLLSLNSTATDNLSDSGYKSNNTGISAGTSFEQYENIFFTPALRSSFETIETSTRASNKLKKQAGDYFDIYLNYTVDYDRRNRSYKADEGFKNSFNQDLPLYSDNFEFVNTFETTKYHKFTNFVTKLSYYGKAANSINGEDVRISKRLYVPSSKLRGFEKGKIGPKENNDFIGGNYVSAVNFSTTIPQLLPSFQNTDILFFVDVADVWGVDYDSSIDDRNTIRSSTGLAIDIFSPIGPLNFSYTFPITKASSDVTETFRFNLGTTF
jgi:outer membrane protein insertion porin family